jgi:hypothetical protein
MAKEPLPEYDASVKIMLALVPLKPAERVTALAWGTEGYCPKCGYPSPPDGEDCGGCDANPLTTSTLDLGDDGRAQHRERVDR